MMKRLACAAAACLMLGGAAHAQALAKLEWMAGSWTQKKADEVVQETWLGMPGAKMMVGSNLTHGAKRSSFEFLRIVETAEGVSYLASPGGRSPPVEFKAKDLGDRKVVFENPGHDFPQRVIYWLDGDGALKARIEGTIGGRERGIEWRFERVK